MLQESKLYSYLDNNHGFAITFFEGQKLIHDLMLMNNFTPKGFSYFRESILSIQPMIAFLKHGEGAGIYIDSETPFFRLKVETNESGSIRTLLLPEDFADSPDKITGICRLTKIFGQGQHPYTSVIQLNELSFKDIMNKILMDSYQVNCKIFVSEDSDQSVMIMKLPNANVNSTIEVKRPSVDEYWLMHKSKFNDIFRLGTTDRNLIIEKLDELNYSYLKEKEVKFHCPCSKDRMISGLKGLTAGQEELFDEGKDTLETKCDYCKTIYSISKNDLI